MKNISHAASYKTPTCTNKTCENYEPSRKNKIIVLPVKLALTRYSIFYGFNLLLIPRKTQDKKILLGISRGHMFSYLATWPAT